MSGTRPAIGSDTYVTPTGSGTPRTLADIAAGTVQAVVVASGNANTDTAALQAAIDAVAAEGGGVVKCRGTFGVNDTIVVEDSNVLLLGDGCDSSHDVGDQGTLAVTELVWSGTTGGTMVQFASPEGASAQKMRGGGMVGISLRSGGGEAAKGLEVLSWNRGRFEDLFFEEFTTAGLAVGCVSTLGEAKDPQENYFGRLSGRFLLQSGAFIQLDGVSDANTSMNLFKNLDVVHNNGNAFDLKNCDNNVFLRTRAVRAAMGTGKGVAFHGSDAAADQVARGNLFIHLTAQDIIGYGTDTYTYASHDNATLILDSGNGTVAPTLETGASCSYSFPDGRLGNHAMLNGIAAATKTGADYARAVHAAGSGAHSLVIVNDSAAHSIWATTGGVRWIARLSGGEFDIALVSGSPGALMRVPGIRHGSSGPTWTSGSGSPEGAVTAVVGSMYSRTDGGASTTLYVKESGTGNTGWRAVQTA